MSRRWPPEWQPHRESIVIWPGRDEVWSPYLDIARAEVEALVTTIVGHEPVRLIVGPRSEPPSRELAMSSGVTIHHLVSDDCWARDIAPLFVHEADAEVAVSLRFNSWGAKLKPYDDDAAFAERLATSLGLRTIQASFVGEGGAIEVDGEGTAIIVEPSVLNPNRNPARTRLAIECDLHDLLGITTVIWLPHGLIDDTDTDGHVDNVARFVRPATVLCQAAGRNADDEARLQSNINRLRRSRDAAGRQLTVIEVPWLPYPDIADRRPASYCNFYIVNGGVVVPLVGARLGRPGPRPPCRGDGPDPRRGCWAGHGTRWRRSPLPRDAEVLIS